MSDLEKWNLKNVVATGMGATGVVLLMISGQVVLASSAAALTYLFVGPLRKKEKRS